MSPRRTRRVGALFFTSGTTGPSKAVATTWHYLFSAAAGGGGLAAQAGGDVWSAMPLFHLSAAPSVLAPMLLGTTTVLSRPFGQAKYGTRCAPARSGFRRRGRHGLDALEPTAGPKRSATAVEVHLGGTDLG